MERKEAERLADKIATDYAKNGVSEKLITDLKNLRNFFIEVKEPKVTRILRLVYELFEDEGEFDFQLEDFNEEEAGMSSFEYLMQLITAYDNKYNVEELEEYKQLLINA